MGLSKIVFIALLPLIMISCGCGAKQGTDVSADQSEMEKYVAEHPESATPNTEGIK